MILEKTTLKVFIVLAWTRIPIAAKYSSNSLVVISMSTYHQHVYRCVLLKTFLIKTLANLSHPTIYLNFVVFPPNELWTIFCGLFLRWHYGNMPAFNCLRCCGLSMALFISSNLSFNTLNRSFSHSCLRTMYCWKSPC